MNPVIVWVLVAHWILSGTDHPIEIYQTEGDCVGVGIYRMEHTSRVTPEGGETFHCVRKGLIDVGD
jgi:hypothetical protein